MTTLNDMSGPYTNRELDEKFKNLDSLIREKHDDTMVKVNEVIVQTTKTNGRVRFVEKMIYLAMGFCTCVTVLMIPLIAALYSSGKL